MNMILHRKKIFILASSCLLILILTQCISKNQKPPNARGSAYAGSATCAKCHQEIYESYLQTTHHKTSEPASRNAIKGNFSNDSNTVYYRPVLKVVMQQTDSGFYQSAFIDNVQKQSVRFDIVIGSGVKGQSYLSWSGNNLFQLPVSYYSPGHAWVNSPSYPAHTVLFNRTIPVGCFECHSSYIKRTDSHVEGSNWVDSYDKKQIIYGIDCERCHGPSADHVAFQEKHLDTKEPHSIASLASLQRQQKLDLCAMCHSGAKGLLQSTFYYKPGDSLSHYLAKDMTAPNINEIDVHGKQYQLLAASQCFLKSGTLTCVSCHNPHTEQRGQIQTFSARCASCHANPDHSRLELQAKQLTALQSNCIDCHMPTRPSSIITMKSIDSASGVSAMVRTHFISIYKEASRKFLKER